MSDDDDDPDFPFGDEGEAEQKRRFERTVPDVFRRVIERALEAGVEKLTEAPENLRELVADLKLPKDATGYVYDQIDDTKKGIYKIVAKEIRDVIEHINFADEFADVLTKLQFEINTTIRFVPNKDTSGEEDEEQDGEPSEGTAEKRPSRIPRPKVVSKVVMKAKEALKNPSKPKD